MATAKTPSLNASSLDRSTALPAQPAAGWPAPGFVSGAETVSVM